MNSDFMNESMNWRRLCRAAAIEQDADRVWQIVRRIDSELARRRRELRRFAKSTHQRSQPELQPLHRAA
jgi:hypothetical protein